MKASGVGQAQHPSLCTTLDTASGMRGGTKEPSLLGQMFRPGSFQEGF